MTDLDFDTVYGPPAGDHADMDFVYGGGPPPPPIVILQTAVTVVLE